MARSAEIVEALEGMPWGTDLILRLKDGTEISGIFEGLRHDQVLIADGTETTFPSETPLGRVAAVVLEVSTEGPE
jgi:hypothetical protein